MHSTCFNLFICSYFLVLETIIFLNKYKDCTKEYVRMELKPNPVLVGTSLFLALPGVLFIQRAEYIQASLSFLCCLFSILWHATKPRYNSVLLADKIFANSTALIAVHTAAKGLPLSVIPASMFIGGALILYHYGHQHKCLLWSPDLNTSTRWHSVLHVGNGLLGVWMVLLVAKN